VSDLVTLVPLTKANWEAVARLEVREEQRGFIDTNLWTIAGSRFYPWVQLHVIQRAGLPVGFAADGRDPEDGTWWLYRFMIGAEHQGNGYGRAGLQALIAEWREAGIASVTVGYQPDNALAERLYLSAGFEPAGIAEWGEKLARLTLPRRDET
jgi:diamine N-acetyltransferase